jgi:hypothetical protein
MPSVRVTTFDIRLRPLFALFIAGLGSRRAVHGAATRNPSQEWTAQQIRNATTDGEGPKLLPLDHDDKYGAAFDRAAQGDRRGSHHEGVSISVSRSAWDSVVQAGTMKAQPRAVRGSPGPVSGLLVEASDLVGPQAALPAASVNVKIVKCWYQAGDWIGDVSHRQLLPELLLNDDSLVTLDEGESYVHLSDGRSVLVSSSTTDPPLTSPTKEVDILGYSVTDFPVKDADTLRPADIPANTNKQFWVTVHVPVSAESSKLGIDVSQATVAKYMVHRDKPPSRDWRTCLDNHVAMVRSPVGTRPDRSTSARAPPTSLMCGSEQRWGTTSTCGAWVRTTLARMWGGYPSATSTRTAHSRAVTGSRGRSPT